MEQALLLTLIASLVAAFVFGAAAKSFGLPTIFGYLLAGVALGPHTPGFVGDASLAKQLAEVGVTLLMFGVGLHFSHRDLLESRKTALPGAALQMVLATAAGAGVGRLLGAEWRAAVIFGLALSVASTIVLLRALEQRRLMDAPSGKLAISWLVVEDTAMVFALVLLPILAEFRQGSTGAGMQDMLTAVAETILKIGGFILLMLMIGRRVLPWLFTRVAALHSAELTLLATLAIALGLGLLADVAFDASLALGAFLAGVLLNESEVGRRAAASSAQMRDAFLVLFFVAVGMLFDPRIMLTAPFAVLLTFLTIVGVKAAAAWAVARWLGQPLDVCLTLSLGLAQIGEFSFMIGGLALTKGLISQTLYDLILAGAMLSIVANPLLFRAADRWAARRAL